MTPWKDMSAYSRFLIPTGGLAMTLAFVAACQPADSDSTSGDADSGDLREIAEPPVPVSPAESAPETAPPAEPPPPAELVLDVRENESAKTITLSGDIGSNYQKNELIADLEHVFGQMKIVDELNVDSRIRNVTWGNRIGDLILPLLEVTTDAHFRYEKGVTLLEGTVSKPGQVGQMGNHAVGVMEAGDSKGLDNRLKAGGEN